MTSDIHKGPLEPAPVDPARRKTWREQRWERRRRRRRYEELLGWIVVPLLLFGAYWAFNATLSAFGTTPSALIQNIRTATGGRL